MKRKSILFLAAFTGLLMTMNSCSKDKVTPDIPSLAVSAENVSAVATAGSYTVNITANVAWTATSNQTWCSITPASGEGNGVLTITVAENTALEARTASITVKAGALTKTVVVAQLGVAPALSVDVTAINVTAEAADSTVEITSNLAWTATSSAAWCLVSPTSGNGSGTLTITIAENTSLEARTATITVSAGDLTQTVTVAQSGATPVLSVDTTKINAVADAESYEIKITSNLAWTTTSNAAWCSITPASGEGNGVLTINVAENTSDGSRTATVTVTAGSLTCNVTVTQDIFADVEFTGTPVNNVISFNAIAQKLIVNWGDGTTNEYSNTTADDNISHTYSDNVTRTVRIKQENLTGLFVTEQGLTSLNVNDCTNISSLDCHYNQLTSLDISKNTKLTELWCSDNLFTSLDISKNTELTTMVCSRNQLASLDVSGCTKLTGLYCESNPITNLDVSKNTELTSLYCDDNRFTSLDLSKNTELTSLYCNYNQLTSLDLSKNTKLTLLYCFYNQLTGLDVSKNTELTSLYCLNNRLTSLDVSKNTKLMELECEENRLTSLDVSKNTKLATLNCTGNQLASLDVSGCTELSIVNIKTNQLSTTALNEVFTELPAVTYGSYILITGNPGTSACDKSIATNKGWNVID
jgi:hypothetical protein